jgi:ribosomal protein L11 methyltransferase
MSELRRVSVQTSGDDAEPLRALLLELVPAGIEERETESAVELAAYVPAERVAALREALPDAVVEPVEGGWEDAWRAFHRAVEVAGLWVGPPWETPSQPSRGVMIDPGRAFGTGAHATTRLCVQLLARTESKGSLLDVGCGSGVLGIAAVRLGFREVMCVDDDPVAVETTRANAVANGVELDVRVLDGETEALPPADVAVANVLLEPVETILARLDAHEAITSGYLAGERPVHPGWAHVETVELDGWAADRFRRCRRPTT